MLHIKKQEFISRYQDMSIKCLCHIIAQAGARNSTQKDNTADEIESCSVVKKYVIYT